MCWPVLLLALLGALLAHGSPAAAVAPDGAEPVERGVFLPGFAYSFKYQTATVAMAPGSLQANGVEIKCVVEFGVHDSDRSVCRWNGFFC
jgi:hypothetical protein